MNVIVPLMGIAGSGLAWIAWHEPKTYRRIFHLLSILIATALTIAVLFNLGFVHSMESNDYSTLSGEDVADIVTSSLVSAETFFLFIGSQLYLTFLVALPLIRGKVSDETPG